MLQADMNLRQLAREALELSEGRGTKPVIAQIHNDNKNNINI